MSNRSRFVHRLEPRPSGTAQVEDAGRATAGAHKHARTRELGRNIAGHLTAREAAAPERDRRWSWARGSESRSSRGEREQRTRARSVPDLAARARTPRWAVLGATLLAVLIPLAAAASAQAASPWWSLDTSVRPATIPSGGEGTIVVRASNLGDLSTPTKETVEVEPGRTIAVGVASTVSLTVPEGLEVVSEAGAPEVQFFAFSAEGDHGPATPVGSLGEYCRLAGGRVECASEPVAPFDEPEAAEAFGIAPIAPYEFLEIRVRVKDVGAATGALLRAEALGGGASAASSSRPLQIGTGEPAFGAESYGLVPEAQGGAPATAAATHPYQLSAGLDLNQLSEVATAPGGPRHVAAPALPRRLAFDLPPGLVGAAAALPACTTTQFNTILLGGADACPPDSAIGVATITFDEPNVLDLATFPVPLFNLEPAVGEPARFGAEFQGLPIVLDTSVRSGSDYGVTVSTSDLTQLANLISATFTLWGVPGDPTHDQSRGWSCLASEHWVEGGVPSCTPEAQSDPPALLTLPADCSAPFSSSVEGESWTDPALHPLAATFGPVPYLLEDGAGHPASLSACDQVPFAPKVEADTTAHTASSPTGLDLEVGFEDEGLLGSQPGARAQSPLKRALITLPPGLTADPSVAVGLGACSEAEYEAATAAIGSGCNGGSKLGEVAITSPLLAPDQVLRGGLFLATPGQNPNHDLLTIYLVARDATVGVLVREALKLTPDPLTGRLTTEVDDIPQLPFSHFHLSFRQGQRSPLVTPPACGLYTVGADLYPYSEPAEPLHRESSFLITAGPEGQGCPSGAVPPFHPNLLAGSENPTAGAYSPFYTEITRKDSEQEITRFSIKLPPGLSGRLVGVAKCSDAAIAAAKSREHERGGEEELQHPSCPASSEVGHTLVGTGVGNVLAYAPGKLYLAGPYKGSNLSIVSITAAKVGPFDLGTVVIREGLKVDPVTAQVSVDAAGSDPIPHIVDGIPVHLRDIRIYVDRPNFTINPTSCAKMSTAATVLGSGLNFVSEADDQPVTVTSPFQAADCASLGFKPKLALKLKGKTRRGGLPKLTATVTYPKQGAYANIAKTVVTLPPSEFLEQGHIGSSCTRVQFDAGVGNGAECPKKSILGHARAITPLLEEPIEGLVYLRSNGGERKLPDLVAALHSEDININLVGFISSLHKKGSEVSQIRNTFAAVPDAPVSKFTLELFGGKKGLLVNSTNICKGTHKAISAFTGQNGKLYDTNPKVTAQCGKKGKKHKGHGKKSGGKKK